MPEDHQDLRDLTHEFFCFYPDYLFCRTLAFNVRNGVTDYPAALEILTSKARTAARNRRAIEEKLDHFSVQIGKERVKVKTLSLREIMKLEDAVLKEILELYLKHPYAHGRTRRTRLLPRWLRTFFLGTLVGHARNRGLKLDYEAYFDMLTLL